MHSMFGSTYVYNSTFSTMKQVKSEKEIEWQSKHWTIVSGSLALTLVLIKDSFTETSITGIPLIEFDNMFLFAIV